MEKKFVLYNGGGSMQGVFGAGVNTGIEELGIYDRISHLYGSSAGAFNNAFLAARQSSFGSTIYWENLTRDFIFPSKILSGTAQRFRIRFFQPNGKSPVNVVDIDHLMKVVQKEKKLDISTIHEQPTPFYVKVLDSQTGRIVYLDARENTLDALKASVSIVPYYFSGNQRFIDADVTKEPIGLQSLLERHPEQKVVVVINQQPNRYLGYMVKNSLEGAVASLMYPHLPMMSYFNGKARSFRRDVKHARENPRVLLIHPPKESSTRSNTTSPKKLKETWEMGRREARKIIDFIR